MIDISIVKTGSMSAQLRIDLEEHLHAYQEGNQELLNTSHKAFQTEMQLISIVFDELISKALQNQPLEFSEIVRNSPAHYYVDKEFAEIVKNAIDSKLKQLSSNLTNNPSTVLTLDVEIETTLESENVRIKISDNGAGFPEKMLNLITNKEARENSNYYETVGSEKNKRQKTDTGSLLMGGAGRGIRELMGLADKGDATYRNRESSRIANSDQLDLRYDRIESLTFDIPIVSNLEFYNKPEGTGAVIDITTSKTPIVFHQPEVTETVEINLPLDFKLKRKTPSPKSISQAEDLNKENNLNNTNSKNKL